jgi:hypothetical protein
MMTTTATEAAQTTPEERAVRLVLGYPAEGPISVAGAYSTGRTYRKEVKTYVDPVDAWAANKWWKLIGSSWCAMLDAAGVPHDGPGTVYRCVCVECALRVMLVEAMTPGSSLTDEEVPHDVARIAAEYEYRVADGSQRFERAIQDAAGLSMPAEAVADASGLRITERGPESAVRLVEHARACTLPFPFRIVAYPIRPEVVGDVS